ncbi:MAG: 1,4-dihydroxy-2-naphthoate octaprenyltransferase [Flavobacteriia bacterium]|nr:1,4-dihydroxy-2-naphthoate octaprenyltransferase [Flavobacteriia bacterium]
MTKISIWIKAFRLRTLPLSLSGIILGSALVLNTEHWNLSIFILSLSTTLCFQILSNLANDLGDHLKGTDNENRVGPQRAVQSGKISVKQMKTAVFIFILLSVISSLSLIYLSLFNANLTIQIIYIFLAVFAILAALFYTLGKKAYGYFGFGDVFVFVFFGLISVLGVFTLYTHFFMYQNLFPAITIGLLSVAVLNLNNMRDIQNDKLSNKKTLVVQIGLKNAKKYHFFLILTSFFSLLLYFLIFKSLVYLFVLIPFLRLFIHLKFVWKNKNEKEMDSQLKVVALNTFFLAILFILVAIIQHQSN